MSHQPWAGLWCPSTPLRLVGTQWPEGCHQPPTLVEWQRLRAPSKPPTPLPFLQVSVSGVPCSVTVPSPVLWKPSLCAVSPRPSGQPLIWPASVSLCEGCLNKPIISTQFSVSKLWMMRLSLTRSFLPSTPPLSLFQADRSAIIHPDDKSPLLFLSLSFSPQSRSWIQAQSGGQVPFVDTKVCNQMLVLKRQDYNYL